MPTPDLVKANNVRIINQTKKGLNCGNKVAIRFLHWMDSLYSHHILKEPSHSALVTNRRLNKTFVLISHVIEGATPAETCFGCARCGRSTEAPGGKIPVNDENWKVYSPALRNVPMGLRDLSPAMLVCIPCLKVLGAPGTWAELLQVPHFIEPSATEAAKGAKEPAGDV